MDKTQKACLSLLPAMILSLLSSCASTPATSEALLNRMLSAGSRDARSPEKVVVDAQEVKMRNEERFRRVHRLLEEGRIRTPKEQMLASLVLLGSNSPADVTLARDLALEAAEAGEEEAFSLAARAIDRSLYFTGAPQRFGTHFIYSPVLSRWKLHNVDPRTTDEERSAYGLPPLADLEAFAAKLDASMPAE